MTKTNILKVVSNPTPDHLSKRGQVGQVIMGLPKDDTTTMIGKKVTLRFASGEQVSFLDRELEDYHATKSKRSKSKN